MYAYVHCHTAVPYRKVVGTLLALACMYGMAQPGEVIDYAYRKKLLTNKN